MTLQVSMVCPKWPWVSFSKCSVKLLARWTLFNVYLQFIAESWRTATTADKEEGAKMAEMLVKYRVLDILSKRITSDTQPGFTGVETTKS